jgi:WD40 repeat protein
LPAGATRHVVGLSEDGATALDATDARELVAVDVATGRRVGRVLNSREFSCLALSRNGRVVATGDYEHDVKLWDLTRLESEPSAWERRGRVESVAVCDDARVAVVAAGTGRELWDSGRGAPIEDSEAIAAERVVRRSQPLLDPSSERQVRARLERALPVKEGMRTVRHAVPGNLAFSLAAGRAVSAPRPGGKYADAEEPQRGRDHPLQLWELGRDVLEPRLLRGHTMPIMCADMNAAGTRALTGSWGRLLRLWDLDAGVCLHVLRGHCGIVMCCALTDDARLAVSGSEDMTVRLWDLSAGKLLFTFSASSAVTACDIARDGSVVIAAEVSGRVHVLQTISGSAIAKDF